MKIDKLKQGVIDHRARRHAALAATKMFQEREREINDAEERRVNSFWCETCQKDFDNMSQKIVRKAVGEFTRAWYESACDKGHKVILHITDKHADPYYVQSKMLKEMRYAMRDEILTPKDERFKYVYPTQWKKIKEEEEMQRAMEEQQAILENS